VDLRTHLKTLASSLAIACVLWLAVHNEEKVPYTLRVPVLYDHPGDIVRLEDVEQVEVRLLASRNRLRTLTPADVRVSVANPEGIAATRTEVLTLRDVETPFGVEVDGIEPARFVVRYDRRGARRVPVRVAWSGEPAAGWRVEEEGVRAEPPSVVVEGPSSLLEELKEVRTREVALDGQSTTVVTRNLQLLPPGELLRLTEPLAVAVEIPIVPRQGRRTFDEVPVQVLRGDWETSPTNPGRLQVVVSGPVPKLERLTAAQVQLRVDVRDKAPKAGDYRVAVEAGVDPVACSDCRVESLAPQRAVDVAVYNRRRATPASPGAEGEVPTATRATPPPPAEEPLSPAQPVPEGGAGAADGTAG
jgi:hypothetical protein